MIRHLSWKNRQINWDGEGWYKEYLIGSSTIEFRRISDDKNDKQFINDISCTWVSIPLDIFKEIINVDTN